MKIEVRGEYNAMGGKATKDQKMVDEMKKDLAKQGFTCKDMCAPGFDMHIVFLDGSGTEGWSG